MTDEAPRNRGGRPKGSTTGQKKLRTLRMGPIWDRSQRLADELAALDGKPKGNLTAYVEAALREHNGYIERRLAAIRRDEQTDRSK
jgi:hypothetical protein